GGDSPRMLDEVFFFFFQAEDGIRDLIVTGVQTCALPIWGCRNWSHASGVTPRTKSNRAANSPIFEALSGAKSTVTAARAFSSRRSEERRVGKECRSRWAPER